jgi:hypothetical protein
MKMLKIQELVTKHDEAFEKLLGFLDKQQRLNQELSDQIGSILSLVIKQQEMIENLSIRD